MGRAGTKLPNMMHGLGGMGTVQGGLRSNENKMERRRMSGVAWATAIAAGDGESWSAPTKNMQLFIILWISQICVLWWYVNLYLKLQSVLGSDKAIFGRGHLPSLRRLCKVSKIGLLYHEWTPGPKVVVNLEVDQNILPLFANPGLKWARPGWCLYRSPASGWSIRPC